MNIKSISSILQDNTSSKKLVNRVLKDNNMQIVHNFSPVKSEYKLNLGKDKRVTLTLNEDEFVQKEERLVNGNWKPSIEFRIKDTAETAENALLTAIEYIKFCANKEYGSKILNSLRDNFRK